MRREGNPAGRADGVRSIRATWSANWKKLIPGLMAILMAILTLLFLIISEALKKD